MNIVEDAEFLVTNGWRESRNRLKTHAMCFYKFYKTETLCRANRDKSGMQIEVALSYISELAHEPKCIELELAGELADGTWLKIYQWMLPMDISVALKVIPRMLKTWEAANG